MNPTNLFDAIRVVKENERKNSEACAEAAKNLVNPVARELFRNLSEFEKYHPEKLTLLEISILETGKFIQYESMAFPTPPSL